MKQYLLCFVLLITSMSAFSFSMQQYVVTSEMESGLKVAALLEKSALVVFTRTGCSSCEQLKSEVFTDPGIANMLKEQCIVIVVEAVKTLYVKYPFDSYLTTELKPYETVNYYELVLKKLGGTALPYTIFLNPGFEILGTIEGYRGFSSYTASLKEFIKANARNPKALVKKITSKEESLVLKTLPTARKMIWTEFKNTVRSLDRFGVYILQKTTLSEVNAFLKTCQNPPYHVLILNR